MHHRLFLSHAAADKELVDDLKTMLQTAVGLGPTDVFYSSGKGTGIPAGRNFVEYIGEAMHSSSFVVSVITPAFLESEFCLAELGAVWAAVDKDFYPLCVPAIDRSRLRATLTGIQVERIEDAATLTDLLQRVCTHVGREYIAAAGTAAAEVFLANLENRLASLQGPTKVPAEDLAAVEGVKAALVAQVAKWQQDYRSLEDRYTQLEAAKTREEIDAIAPPGDLAEQIDALIRGASIALYQIDSIVRKALPYSLRGGGMPWPDAASYDSQDVREAVDNGFLRDGNDGRVYVNDTDWPDIEQAARAIRELQDLLESLNPDEERWFRETYGVPADLRQGAAFDRLL